METKEILIVGGGPIAASTAFHLAKSGKKVTVIKPGDDDQKSAAYRNAGGCIRWFWDEKIKADMTTETAMFVKELIKKGVDLSAIEDYYHFVYRGAFTPALNINGFKFVNYLFSEAASMGAEILLGHILKEVKQKDGIAEVTTDNGNFRAEKVLLALGTDNEKFMPGLELEKEKRQIFVTDIEVTPERENLPHTIVPVGDDAYGFVFIKKIDDQLKVVVGQEDIVEDDDETKAVDYWNELMESDLTKIMPWLKGAKVEKILWGVDAGNKTLRIENKGALYSANCGSAVRGSVYIGRTLAEELSK